MGEGGLLTVGYSRTVVIADKAEAGSGSKY